jgi:hypothetical protein
MNLEESAVSRILELSHTYFLTYFLVWVLSRSLILRPTVSRPICLGIKHPFGAYDQIFITVRQLWVRWCGALSMTTLSFTIAAGPRQRLHSRSESRGTRDNILLSQIRDFPFCRLLRLAGLRWRYWTRPPHGTEKTESEVRSEAFSLCSVIIARSYEVL